MAETSNILMIILIILGGVFFVLGGVLALVGNRAKKKARASQSWNKATGTITQASLKEHASSGQEDHITTINYEPRVEYTYEVSGVSYMGKRIAFGANTFNYNKAREIVGRYPPGSAVTVNYDPQKPEEAVLETQAQGGTIFLVVGMILAALGLTSCCAALALLVVGAA